MNANILAAGPSRQDPPPEPIPQLTESSKVVAKKPPPFEQHEEHALGHRSDEDAELVAKVSKSKVSQKTTKSNQPRAKVAPDDSEDEDDGEAGGAKASKPKPSKPVKKSVYAPPPVELLEEAHAEDVATTFKQKVPATVAKASRPRMSVTFAQSKETSDEMASAQQQSTSKPPPKPRKRATKASIRESEEEPQQAPTKLTAKKGFTKGNVKRARDKDNDVITINEPGPTRKKARTTATSDFQSNEETLVAQAPPKRSELEGPVDSTQCVDSPDLFYAYELNVKLFLLVRSRSKHKLGRTLKNPWSR